MKNENLINWLNENSVIDDSWRTKAEFRENNEWWLNKTAKISIKILRRMRSNKSLDRFPYEKKDVAKFMLISQLEFEQILKGNCNFSFQTLIKIEEFLEEKIINLDENMSPPIPPPSRIIEEDLLPSWTASAFLIITGLVILICLVSIYLNN